MAENQELFERAKRRFKLVSESESAQREREREDLAFAVPENQWSDEARADRKAKRVGGGVGSGDDRYVLQFDIPERPCLVIPLLDQPMNMILNQLRQSELGINIDPLSPSAGDDASDVFEGLQRQIQRDSDGWSGMCWAYDRAVKAGRGWWAIYPEYSQDPDDEDEDQVIRVRRLLRQEMVYIDPAAEKSDFSDARFAFVGGWVPKDTFEHDYPEQELPSDAADFSDATSDEPRWVRGSGDTEAYFVAEYFEVTFDSEKRGARTLKTPKVTWSKVCGSGVLEGPNEWPGKYIPLVPAIGIEHQVYDDDRRWAGLIRYGRDAQEVFNWAVSSMVERAAIEPKAPHVGDYRLIAGFESFWAQANITPFSFLPYDSTPETLNAPEPMPPPQRSEVSAQAMAPHVALAQQAKDWVQAALSTYDPSLGALQNRDVPATAIQALQNQGDTANSGFLYNLTHVSLPHHARIINDMIPHIYQNRLGRVLRVLDAEGKTDRVMVGVPYHLDGDDGQGVPYEVDESGVPRNVPREQWTPAMQRNVGRKPRFVDLNKGQWAIKVSVGRPYKSRLDEQRDVIAKLMSALPEMLVPILGPEFIRSLDMPGGEGVAELLEAVREKSYPGIGLKEGEEPNPAQMRSMLQRASQENEQLKGQLQQAAELLRTEQIKYQAQLQGKRMDNETRLAIEAAKAENQASLKRIEAALQDMEQRWKTGESAKGRVHEAVESRKDREHETDMQRDEHAHETALELSKPQPQRPAGGTS